MLFGNRLPNDLLHNAPWSDTIATWPINEAFLKAIEESEEKLRELGYYVLYGIEANIVSCSAREAEPYSQSTSMLWRQVSREQFRNDLARVKGQSGASQQFADIYSQLEKIAELREQQQQRSPRAETVAWLDNWKLTQTFYAKSCSSFESSDVTLARKNFFIAALHLMPQESGGLAGLIEQRFASAHYGKGWWDGDNVIELRTLPTRGHENAVAAFHETLWKLKNAVEYFNFVPVSHLGAAQVHFSVWRAKDNVNLLALKDPESLVMQAKLAESLRDRLILADARYPSKAYTSRLLDSDEPIVGSSRASAIRICEDGHWELRLGHTSGVTHVARDIYLIAASIRDHFEPLSAEAKRDQEFIDAAQKQVDEHAPGQAIALPIQKLLIPHFDESQPVRVVQKMKIESAAPRTSCPFMSSLEGGFIDDKGEIDIPLATLRWNIRQMRSAIGRGNENLFTVKIKGENHNLERAVAWRELFKKLKLLPDGEIDTSALDHRLAKPFIGLRVSDIRNDIHGGEINEIQSARHQYTNTVMTKWLAEGKVSLVGRQLSQAEQQIYGFLNHRSSIFDPQEAVIYLLELYHKVGGYAVHSPKDTEKVVEMAAQQILYEAVGDWLSNIRSYPGMLADTVDCFPEHEMLRFMITLRESLVEALPSLSKLSG